MENIWAIHEGGNKPSSFAWLKDNDPIYPCNEPKIPYKYIKACWSNQPMQLFRFFAADLAKAGRVCLSIKDKDHQTTCFDGLARQIHPETHGSVEETFRMCSYMPTGWVAKCVKSIVKAFFSVGDRTIPFVICNRIEDAEKESCFTELAGIITAYIRNVEDKKDLCNQIPYPQYQAMCLR